MCPTARFCDAADGNLDKNKVCLFKNIYTSTIYFAVDYDASEKEIDGNIKKHFKVLRSKLSLANYSVGVYGSSLVCKKLKEAKLVDKTWLANASGWGYGTKFSDYNMKQSSSVKIGNITFDKDVASSINNIGGMVIWHRSKR